MCYGSEWLVSVKGEDLTLESCNREHEYFDEDIELIEARILCLVLLPQIHLVSVTHVDGDSRRPRGHYMPLL